MESSPQHPISPTRTYLNVVLAALGVLLGSLLPVSHGNLSNLQDRTFDGSRNGRLTAPSDLKLCFEVAKKKRSDVGWGGRAPAITASDPPAVFDSCVAISVASTAPVRAKRRIVTSAQPRAPPAGTLTRAA